MLNNKSLNIDTYAVIGNPIKHSLSPIIHHEFALQTQQNLTYIRIEAPLDGFEKTVFEFRHQGGKGTNVTLPFKEQAFQLATQHSELALQAKAANTLLFQHDGSIYADSTDGIGLIKDLTINHAYSLQNKKILLLGAGGAARTILAPLLALKPAQFIIANRTPEKAVQLAGEFQLYGEISGLGLDELNNNSFDLIINATSAGLTGSPLMLPTHLITDSTWCYDLMYGKTLTPFLQWAQLQHPAKCLDGLGMLVEQAAAAFYLWRGVYPDTSVVINKIRRQ